MVFSSKLFKYAIQFIDMRRVFTIALIVIVLSVFIAIFFYSDRPKVEKLGFNQISDFSPTNFYFDGELFIKNPKFRNVKNTDVYFSLIVESTNETIYSNRIKVYQTQERKQNVSLSGIIEWNPGNRNASILILYSNVTIRIDGNYYYSFSNGKIKSRPFNGEFDVKPYLLYYLEQSESSRNIESIEFPFSPPNL